jgi:hypothetical protein
VSTMDFAGAAWRKSSYSGGTGGGNDNCVEVALVRHLVGVRDSKNPAGPVLGFPARSFSAFRSHVEVKGAGALR